MNRLKALSQGMFVSKILILSVIVVKVLNAVLKLMC